MTGINQNLIMSVVKEVQEMAVKNVPNVEVGHTVKVHEKIKEGNKERVQIFEGLVLKINSGHGADKTFTVRRMSDGFGVEKIFPMFSPLIEIELVKKAKVRRAKLYYMRERTGKAARLKETFVSKDKAFAKKEEAKVEAPAKEAEATPAESAE